MVKRAPTPPPAWDDEPKYFVVYQPYPINANMELPGDRIRCSFWLACILGDPEYLNALYHKPSSQSIVIIEVKRGFTNDRALLGAHRWQEFLRTSQADEKDRASMIYYCSYNTGRHVQKDGWRRKEVEAAWFHASQWRLYNSIVKYPYPSTHGCGLPPQDVIHRSLARPLPVGHFPPPPPTRAPPPGSEAYLEAKKREASTPKKRISVGGPAWSIGSPQANEGPEDRGPLDLWGISPSDSGSSEPSSLGSTSDGRLLATPSPTSSVPIPVAPPGLLTPYGITVDQGPPGLVHPSRQVFISPSIYTDNEEEADSEYLPLSAMVTQMDDMTIMDGGELESHVFEAADMAPPPSTPDEENLWAGYGTEVKDAAADPNEMLCPDHGTTCGKGICQTRAAWKKQLEREQRERERKEGGNRGRGRGRERGGGE
ncbi:hypothetical protein OE88DRAFT_191365 [Heliocybe sulcata]|uniref:Uncharacterized protein n=1 Tax=Heliocybe sulcata TaxID=5364 RepID=A0A5C3N377_9AGAM|nr:hypothetical protein OE88DRAFT_191365 [Heliocybe sulcata]